MIPPTPIHEPIPRTYEGFSLQGKKKHSSQMDKVTSAILSIHRSIGWPQSADELSLKRVNSKEGRSVFAIASDGKVLGYATARENFSDYDDNGDELKAYYISFIAVDPQIQHKGIGLALLMRLIEKIKKKGAVLVTLEFEDTPKLCAFYQHPSIPYTMKLRQGIGYICTNTEGIDRVKNRIKYDLTKKRSETNESSFF